MTVALAAATATTTLPCVYSGRVVSSFCYASNYLRSFSYPINVSGALSSIGIRYPSARRRCTFNVLRRGIYCLSTDISDVGFSSCSLNSYPPYGRLLPCPSENGPPRVEHLVVSEGGPVLEYISQTLNIPPVFVADLIRFGAVFYALVCPEPPPTATIEQMEAFKKYTDPSLLRKRSSIKGKTIREAQKTFRVASGDDFVEAGTYLRVHVHPKRFPRCYEIDWKSRIIAVTENYVVLDKPAGTSVGGTTDNIEETCATFTSRALGLDAPLKTTHQIDNCTEGCVILARNKEYCSIFHEKIREKQVKKLYLALAATPPPIGLITHYMRPVNLAPRLISSDFMKGWLLCQLEVMECKKVPWPTRLIEATHIEDCGWPTKDYAYECTINLLTGRTHQIRAQLAACGAPLVGDSTYMPAAIAESENPGLNPFGRNKKDYGNDEEARTLAMEEWIKHHGKEPSAAIGLQACHISWIDDDGERSYKAGSPWWR